LPPTLTLRPAPPRRRPSSLSARPAPAPRWVQSFLAGVQELALGGRDERGTLVRVHTVPVQQLPGLSAAAGQPWDADALLRFGDECLAWMRARAGAAGEGEALRFSHDPARRAVACAPAPGGGGGGGLAARLRALLGEGGGGGAGDGGGEPEAG
jgi:hypothetical protein